jgi:hypothetical protein
VEQAPGQGNCFSIGFGRRSRRLVEHYIEYQRQFADRLRKAPGAMPPPTDSPDSAKGVS